MDAFFLLTVSYTLLVQLARAFFFVVAYSCVSTHHLRTQIRVFKRVTCRVVYSWRALQHIFCKMRTSWHLDCAGCSPDGAVLSVATQAEVLNVGNMAMGRCQVSPNQFLVDVH